MSRHQYKKICRSTICFDQISNYLFKCLSFSIAIASLLLSSLLFSLLPRPVIFFFTSETLSLSLLLPLSHHSYLSLTTPTPTPIFLSPLLHLPSSHHSYSYSYLPLTTPTPSSLLQGCKGVTSAITMMCVSP